MAFSKSNIICFTVNPWMAVNTIMMDNYRLKKGNFVSALETVLSSFLQKFKIIFVKK